MKTERKINLIEKIEGEAKLHLKFKDNIIDDAFIEFFNSRDIERILLEKYALDALVITPRVCGICNQSHLLASVSAIEDCYSKLIVPENAKIIRELALNFELIQNHFKWFYLVILPLFGKKEFILKATVPSAKINQAIAILAGQYPHNSFAIPGGITNEILPTDLIKIKVILNEVMGFFQKEVVKSNIDKFLECNSIENFLKNSGDLIDLVNHMMQNDLSHIGKSYDRFIVFGKNSFFNSGKSKATTITKTLNIKHIKEFEVKNTLSKSITYKDEFYEVGPLSRAMLNRSILIKEFHRRYKDSSLVRIIARICEIPELLRHSLKLLENINFNQPFYTKASEISKISGSGVGIVEAARGSLIHKIIIKEGIIKDYQIITPTQWNLGNGVLKKQGTTQKAIIGLNSSHLAEIVFKSFDVCSVCTTH